MSKSFSFNKIVSICIYTLTLTVLAFGQGENIQNDLNKSFKKFNIVRFNDNGELRRAESRQSIIVPTADKNFELNLTPRDLRTAAFRAEETNQMGSFPLERSAVTTYKGEIAGESGSKVRLTIQDSKIEGYFMTATGRRFFIEPATNYSKAANAGDSVVFEKTDMLKNTEFVCHSEIEEKIERGKEIIGSRTAEEFTTLRVIEIATETDFAFVTEMGGAAQANNEVLSILNMIEGDYETELGLSFDVVFQHAWTSEDPFNGAGASAMLNSFLHYWNTNYPQTSVPRDTAHLWTSRVNFFGQGLSKLGVICSNPGSAYGMSGRINFESIQFVLSAHEIGHNLNANHATILQGCDNTIMNPVVSNLTPLNFCPFSRTEIVNFADSSGGCLSERTVVQTKFDYDGDGKSDVSVFRPSNGAWYLNQSSAGFTGAAFGVSSDKIVPADYDGDGKTDIAVYRNGSWYLNRSQLGFTGIAFGDNNDVPAPADFDGDGKTDIAVFRPSNGAWFVQGSRAGFYSISFGQSGDVPVPADFDGDNKADINVFRPSNGGWYRLNSSNNQFYGAQFGQNGDKALAADFDGDGKADLAIYRPSNGGWYRITSSNNSFAATAFGNETDFPTPADFDGDGKTDVAVYRSSNGTWYRYNSSNGAFVGVSFGAGNDIPTQAYMQ
jgi:hypothetical protein